MSVITPDQMFRQNFVMGMVQRFGSSHNLLQKMMGHPLGSPGSMRIPLGRYASVDVTQPNRSVGGLRAPQVGPRNQTKKNFGQFSIACYRQYEAIDITDEDMAPYRALGRSDGSFDSRAVSQIAQFMSFQVERFVNTREFAIARLLQGGFGMKTANDDSDNMILTELDDVNATHTIGSQMPASHLGKLPQPNANGVGTTDLITTSWDDSSAQIATMCNNVNEAMLFWTGKPLKYVVITTATYNNMLKNTTLQSQGGTVQRPFESLNKSQEINQEGDMNGPFFVTFRAIPLFTFVVYDAWVQLEGDGQNQSNARDRSKTVKLIPENKALFIPQPSQTWFGFAEGSEPIHRTPFPAQNAPSQWVHGFNTWNHASVQPPGTKMHFLENGLPFLTMRETAMFADVIYS